jgi:hypothetical protein
VTDQLEALVTDQVLDVAARAGEEIVDSKDFMTTREQGLAEKGADVTRSSGNKNTPTKMHWTILE